MKTQQPIWKFLANLGDVNPFISAVLVYIDITGVYPPEMVIFNEDSRDELGMYRVSRISLEKCTMLNYDPSTLSANSFHADKPEWFAKDIKSVADSIGKDVRDFTANLVSNDPIKLAECYEALAGYFGPDNFDSCPVWMSRTEIRKAYRAAFK